MKKISMTLFIFICAMLLLFACQQNEKMVDDGEEESQQEKNKGIVLSDAESETENVFHDLTFDYGTNQLVLSDLVANVELKSLELEENIFADHIMKWDQGYVVEVLSSNEPVQQQTMAELDIVMYPDEMNGYMIQLYDEKLTLQREIDLTNRLPEDLIEGAPSMAVSSDGSKIAWAYITDVYVYDVNNDTLTTILNEATNQVAFEKISFTEDQQKLIFLGSQNDEDEQDYGVIDLETKEISLHTEKQFQGDDIQMSPKYASITDYEDPRSNTSSGKVLIVDVQTGESFVMKVDGTESTLAQVTVDGEHLLTVKDEENGSYLVRQYELETGRVVKEERFKPSDQESKVLAIHPTNNPSIYQMEVFMEGKYNYFSFTSEGS